MQQNKTLKKTEKFTYFTDKTLKLHRSIVIMGHILSETNPKIDRRMVTKATEQENSHEQDIVPSAAEEQSLANLLVKSTLQALRHEDVEALYEIVNETHEADLADMVGAALIRVAPGF